MLISWAIVSFILLYSSVKFVFTDFMVFPKIYEPFGRFSANVKKILYSPFDYFTSLDTLVEENQKLNQTLNNYQLILQKHEEVIAENNRLRKMINAPKYKSMNYKTSFVIGKSPDIWHKELIISLGKADGIKVDDTVLSYSGLIGRVRGITDNTSIVQLITDTSVWVSCQNNRSRDNGMIKTENNQSGKLAFLVNKPDFKVDDIIVTSGLGGIYPKGIPIGLVSKVVKTSGDAIPEVYVDFLTDFDKLEEVIVVSDK